MFVKILIYALQHQVYHKYPEAPSEASVSDVLSGSERLFEAVH